MKFDEIEHFILISWHGGLRRSDLKNVSFVKHSHHKNICHDKNFSLSLQKANFFSSSLEASSFSKFYKLSTKLHNCLPIVLILASTSFVYLYIFCVCLRLPVWFNSFKIFETTKQIKHHLFSFLLQKLHTTGAKFSSENFRFSNQKRHSRFYKN